MESKTINLFYGICKPHLMEGQNRNNRFDCLHLDAQNYSSLLKEASFNEILRKAPTTSPSKWMRRKHRLEQELFRNFQFNTTKFELLQQLFIKYLQLRCPSQTVIQNEYDAFVVSALLSTYTEKGKDFDPEGLWKLMKVTPLLDTYSLLHNAVEEMERINPTDGIFSLQWTMIIPFNIKYISLFGEFLYFIATAQTDFASPLVHIRKHATENESQLLMEIRATVTPKLGILTYIVYKNSTSRLDRRMIENIFRSLLMVRKTFRSIHSSYIFSLTKLRQIPTLNEFFLMFQRYFCTEINQSACYFVDEYTSSVINLEYLNDLEDPSAIIKSNEESSIPDLVFVLKYVVEIIFYLQKKNLSDFSFKAFRALPKYLEAYRMPKNIDTEKNFIFKKNGTFHSVEAMFLAVSFLLDFFFIENWHCDVMSDCVEICNEIKVILETRFNYLNEIIKESVLFPFV